MGALAFLFPGQGARNVSPRAGPLMALALERLGLTLEQLSAEGGRRLEQTDVLQPVLTARSLEVARALLRAGVRPDVVLGHSLGELAACAVAGAFDDATAIRLAAERGRLMAREAALHPGGLAVVRALEEAQRYPALELAAVNAPDEVVLGGALGALGGLPRVPVSGSWHTSAMRGAVDELARTLDAARPLPLTLPLVRNLDGAETRSVDTLVAQLTAPVQFTRALASLVERGVDTIVCVGPGLVMRGLVRKNLGTRVRLLTTEDDADVSRTIAACRAC
jgi:[acyl-carrier-protein] S-malonyltransferase